MFKKLVFLLSLFPMLGFASSQTALIDNIQVMTDGRIAITLVGTRTGKPTCASYDYWFIADENSTAGKAQYSLLLTALAAGRPILLEKSGVRVNFFKS